MYPIVDFCPMEDTLENLAQSRDQPESAVQIAGVSLADVIARIEADQNLAAARKREMLSALRSISRILTAAGQPLSAEPRLLRQHLNGVSHNSAGLSRGRWNNIRSLTLAALKHAGVRTMPGNRHHALAPPWEVLRAQLPDKRFQYGLSRFMGFCSLHRIAPEHVDATVLKRFELALENDSLARKPRQTYRATCVLWNKAIKAVPGWPNVEALVPNLTRRYSLAWTDFPASFRTDVEAYLTPRGDPDPFAADYAPPLSPATIEARRPQLLQLATAVVKSGHSAERITGLAALVEPANARAALLFFWERAEHQKKESLYNHAVLLRGIARHWVKQSDDDREALESLCRNLAVKQTGMTDKNRELLRKFDDLANVDALLGLPDRIVRAVRRNDRGGRRDAMRVMFAVAIEFLIVAPMRIKNLASLEQARHIVRTRHGAAHITHLVIPGKEVKNGEPLELPLPEEATNLLDLYLRDYHARLSPIASPWLFPGWGGKRRNTEGFSARISKFILAETGIKMHVHLFRQLAVKLHLEAHPEDVETARRILGHKSLKTTMRAYADIKTTSAFRQYDGMIAALREDARTRPWRGGAAARGAV